MSQLLTTLLTLILVHGYPIVAGIIFIGYFGIPIPLDAVLIASGSFTNTGILNFWTLVFLVATTATACDIFGYLVAKKYGSEVIKKTFLSRGLTNKRLLSLSKFLEKWGWISLFITRWLITPLGGPMDILAGISGYSFKKFFISVATGELLWALIYTYVGKFFGANWQAILIYINNVPGVLALITIGAIFSYLGLTTWNKRHKTN